MNYQSFLQCNLHPENQADIACLFPGCAEQSRFLCKNCMSIEKHLSHSACLIDLQEMQLSTDGSSLHNLESHFLKASYFQGKGPSQNKVHQFFELMEKQIITELRRVRNSVIQVAQMRQNVLANISNQIVFSEAKISQLIENKLKRTTSGNSSIESLSGIIEDINEYNNQDIFDKEIQSEFMIMSDTFNDSSLKRSCFNLQNNNNNYANNNNNSSFTFNQAQICEYTSPSINNFIFNSSTCSQPPAHLQISSQISKELISLEQSCNQALIESDVQMHQLLQKCTFQPNPFTEELSIFLMTCLPRKQEAEKFDLKNKTEKEILQEKFEPELFEQKLQVVSPGEFFQRMGYKNCIAIDDLNNISLLKKVSSLLFHRTLLNQIEQADEFQQYQQQQTLEPFLNQNLHFFSSTNDNLHNSDEGNTSSFSKTPPKFNLSCQRTESAPIYFSNKRNKKMSTSFENEMKESCQQSWQKDYFFSLFFNNKQINDSHLMSIANDLNELSFLSCIHLDFEENNISSLGYISLFSALKQFSRIDHLDLRFNNNYSPDYQATQSFIEVLQNHKECLRVLCLTMKSLKYPKMLSSTSFPSSPLDTSSSSCSSQSQLITNSGYLQSAQLQKQFGQKTESQGSRQQKPSLNLQNNKRTLLNQENQQKNNTYKNSNLLTVPTHLNTQSCEIPDGFQASDVMKAIMEGVKALCKLKVFYFDFSSNDLSLLDIHDVFSGLKDINELEMLHFVFNKTALPTSQALDLMAILNQKRYPLKHCKLFFKDNKYSFQQQRTISGQFQKVSAISKNFDLFF